MAFKDRYSESRTVPLVLYLHICAMAEPGQRIHLNKEREYEEKLDESKRIQSLHDNKHLYSYRISYLSHILDGLVGDIRMYSSKRISERE
jgi:hypothetical protein